MGHTLNRSKRVAAHLREEKSAVVQAGSRQYIAKLVNLSTSGALVSSLGNEFIEEIGSQCDLFFGGAGPMIVMRSELIRVNGCHAAFKFLQSTRENSEEVESKIDRMAALNETFRPTFIH
jgi:hypothetical protein